MKERTLRTNRHFHGNVCTKHFNFVRIVRLLSLSDTYSFNFAHCVLCVLCVFSCTLITLAEKKERKNLYILLLTSAKLVKVTGVGRNVSGNWKLFKWNVIRLKSNQHNIKVISLRKTFSTDFGFVFSSFQCISLRAFDKTFYKANELNESTNSIV